MHVVAQLSTYIKKILQRGREAVFMSDFKHNENETYPGNLDLKERVPLETASKISVFLTNNSQIYQNTCIGIFSLE